jgi:hypothetical protein
MSIALIAPPFRQRHLLITCCHAVEETKEICRDGREYAKDERSHEEEHKSTIIFFSDTFSRQFPRIQLGIRPLF